MKHGMTLALALLATVAAPLAAQSFSEGFTFLKAVRERDGATAERTPNRPSPAQPSRRDREGARTLVRGRDLTG